MGLAGRHSFKRGLLRAIKIHYSMHSLPPGSRAFIADKGAVIVVIEVNGARNLRQFPKFFRV